MRAMLGACCTSRMRRLIEGVSGATPHPKRVRQLSSPFQKAKCLPFLNMSVLWTNSCGVRSGVARCQGIAYDNNGSTLTDAQGRSYTWDFENRLTQVVNPGVGTTTFKYDPFGRRIQKSGPLGATNYLYDRMGLVEEVDNSGNVLARYTQGKGIDKPLAQLRS